MKNNVLFRMLSKNRAFLLTQGDRAGLVMFRSPRDWLPVTARAGQEGRCVAAGAAAFGKTVTLTLSEHPGDGVVALDEPSGGLA